MVCIADGSLSKVVGVGSINITENMTLNFGLLVPNLTYSMDVQYQTHQGSELCYNVLSLLSISGFWFKKEDWQC